jgi:hypothetical protein
MRKQNESEIPISLEVAFETHDQLLPIPRGEFILKNDKSKSAPAFAWTMEKGSAQIFAPRTAGVLRVSAGCAWVTWNASPYSPQPRWCPEIDPGDISVGSGVDLPLRRGQKVVIESWPANSEPFTLLVWEPAAVSASANLWQGAVVQPARELGQGLIQVARALRRLGLSLAGNSEF